LYYNDASAFTLYPGYPGLNFIAQVVTNNLPLVTIIGLGYFIYALAYDLVILVVISRCFFAWSFDRIIPAKFADVHSRFRTPYVSLIAMGIMGLVFLVWIDSVPVFFSWYWVSIPTDLPWIGVSIAAIVFPYRCKKIFENSPVNYRIGSVPVISILGVLSTIVCSVHLGVLCFDPDWAWGGAVAPGTLVFVAALIIISAGTYFGTKFYRKRKGIDMGLAFKEIPPE
jgi:amino acid transporter